MPDRDAIRDAFSELLQEHGLTLEKITWTDDLKKRQLGVALKITGDLDIQQEMAFGE